MPVLDETGLEGEEIQPNELNKLRVDERKMT